MLACYHNSKKSILLSFTRLIWVISVYLDEIELRQKVKMIGCRWNSREKVWKIAYGKVKILNLEERIVEKTQKK